MTLDHLIVKFVSKLEQIELKLHLLNKFEK